MSIALPLTSLPCPLSLTKVGHRPRALVFVQTCTRKGGARVDVEALAQLAQQASTGNQRAFQALVEQTTPMVYRLALRLLKDANDAEDVVQETYLRAWRRLHTLKDFGATLHWLCQVARFVATDQVRARGRRKEDALEAFDDDKKNLANRLAHPGADPETEVMDQRSRNFVRAVIESLPEKHRVVLALADLDGLSTEEVSAAIGVPAGTVASRLHRARAAFAKKMSSIAKDKQGIRGWFS